MENNKTKWKIITSFGLIKFSYGSQAVQIMILTTYLLVTCRHHTLIADLKESEKINGVLSISIMNPT